MFKSIVIDFPKGIAKELVNENGKLEITVGRDGRVEKMVQSTFRRAGDPYIPYREETREERYPELRDGSIIVFGYDVYAVYDGTKPSSENTYYAYVVLNIGGESPSTITTNTKLIVHGKPRVADRCEEEKFYRELRKLGYEWDLLDKRLNRL